MLPLACDISELPKPTPSASALAAAAAAAAAAANAMKADDRPNKKSKVL